jgi:hypothetical protein
MKKLNLFLFALLFPFSIVHASRWIAYTSTKDIDCSAYVNGGKITTSGQDFYCADDSGGGGSQTPWTSDIDGGGFSLANVSTITVNTVIASSINYSDDGTYYDSSAYPGAGYGLPQSLIEINASDYYTKPFAALNINQGTWAGPFPLFQMYVNKSAAGFFGYGYTPSGGFIMGRYDPASAEYKIRQLFNDDGSITAISSVTGSAFYGDASHLTGLPASGPFTQAVATTTVSMPFGATSSTFTATSTTTLQGQLKRSMQVVTSSTTLSTYQIVLSSNFVNVGLTLPPANVGAGICYDIKKVCTSTNVVTILPSSSQKIDNAVSFIFSVPYSAYKFCSDALNWWVF